MVLSDYVYLDLYSGILISFQKDCIRYFAGLTSGPGSSREYYKHSIQPVERLVALPEVYGT